MGNDIANCAVRKNTRNETSKEKTVSFKELFFCYLFFKFFYQFLILKSFNEFANTVIQWKTLNQINKTNAPTKEYERTKGNFNRLTNCSISIKWFSVSAKTVEKADDKQS